MAGYERPFAQQGACNICGSADFTYGGLTRAPGVPPPQCVECRSVERHRLIRSLYGPLRPLAREWRAFQFAPDRSVDPGWFLRYDSSIYEQENSVDMMNTGFADGSYDIVISNHVLEHVSDDFMAMRETLRIVGENGVVHICIPSPIYRWETRDWGFADPAQNFHYRDYGADFPNRILRGVPGGHCIAAIGADPVVGATDIVYFLSRSAETLRGIGHQFQRNAIPICRFW